MSHNEAADAIREICRLTTRILSSPATFRSRLRAGRLYFGRPMNVGRRLGAPWRCVRTLLRWGPQARRLSGRSLWRQLVDLLTISLRYRHTPSMYYVWELHRDGRMGDAGLYVDSIRNAEIQFALLPRRRGNLGKADFHELCEKKELRTVPVLARCSARWKRPKVSRPEAPEWNGDLYEKPVDTHQGEGIRRWVKQEGGGWICGEERAGSREELLQAISASAERSVHMVQPRRSNHPDIEWVAEAPISTVRIVTLRPPGGGEIEMLPPWMRIPRAGAAVDNLHQGGMLAPVDLETGRIGRLFDWRGVGLDPGTGRHPDSDRQVEGVVVPYWEGAKELCRRAQEVFSERASVGWDVGIDAEGPFLLELNGMWGTDVLQALDSLPFGLTPFAPIMLEHLRARARALRVRMR